MQDFDCQDSLSDDATEDSSSSSSSGDDSSNSSRTCAAQYLSDTRPPLIVPRFIAELSADDLTAVLQKPGKAIAAMVDEVVQQNFDGLVRILFLWCCWLLSTLVKHSGVYLSAPFCMVQQAQGCKLMVGVCFGSAPCYYNVRR